MVLQAEGLAVAMCRALKVMCVASDAGALAALKRAAVAAEWELTSGATEVATSLDEIRGLVKGSPRPGGPIIEPDRARSALDQ